MLLRVERLAGWLASCLTLPLLFRSITLKKYNFDDDRIVVTHPNFLIIPDDIHHCRNDITMRTAFVQSIGRRTAHYASSSSSRTTCRGSSSTRTRTATTSRRTTTRTRTLGSLAGFPVTTSTTTTKTFCIQGPRPLTALECTEDGALDDDDGT